MTQSSSARPSRRPTRGRGAAQGRPKSGAGRQKSAPVARPQEFTMPEPLTPALPPVAAFEDMDMPEALLKTLAAQGVTEPFPIQAATLPNSLAGRDLLGRGRTGSGKTLAFGLALLARTAGHRAQPKQPLALVLVPTRELAQQVTDALAPYATAVNLRIATVVGGMSINRQSGALRRGAEVLVATPGRLKDLIDRGDADLSQVAITVLDEADQMTDMGFMPQVTALLKQVRADGQTMLFSATLDKNIDKLVKMFLHDPVAFSVDPSAGAVSTMEHHVLYVLDETDKKAVATRIAARDGRVIMFVDTKRGVDRMVKKLLADGVRASGLHGGRSQPQRNRTLDWFKTGEVTALVATNVAARGIHIDDLDLVVNVDPPTDHKDYLHRGGRTARAGESGSVVTLVLPDQKRDMTRLMSDAGISPRTAQIRSSDAELARLTGAKEPSGIPVVLDVPQPTAPKPRNGSGSGSGSRRRSGGPRTGSATGGAPAAGGRGRRSGGGGSGQAPAASGSGQARRGQGSGGGATGSAGQGRRTGGGASGGAAAASARSRVGSGGQGRRRAV
ncbi:MULTISPECIES: DEAD/DEAH box helicase [unclassified Streptomyces]|uniref:DEAD/DEAH box helicase n=1 Tax=unclassified Streptomyces TaxID=2593676 RepID=UPI0022565A66|nr:MULTISPECIES: DEAD/DEAH box helicase [unclassified Streptomyces]MCX5014503.1 DEAD/DEAH box helicase [Streptomyces sp. NBC_00555]MCX5608519.1 DEAD/DEAH box helicase [Streptomyces sp. NBC_00047]